MRSRQRVERVIEGEYLAEVQVQLMDDDVPGSGWGPYYSLSDIKKLEAVREALRSGDLAEASRCARIYRITPVSAA